jgi:hypothetical protein
MIVLNGMPFLPYNLRALYPFAQQIVVVEGAAPGAAGIAAPDGHSRDGTLGELRRFARDEDPEGKLLVVTAGDHGYADGFWPGEKDEQSRAYASRATGDYLWQIDVDEFYLPASMQLVLDVLAGDPEVTAVTFPTLTFWGSPDCVVDSWFLRRGAANYHRLFRWGPGFTYATHRPPTVLDHHGRDTRSLKWLDAGAMSRLGVAMYHYSLLFPALVAEKVEYYSNWGRAGDWFAGSHGWLTDSYLTLRRPYRVHNVYHYPSWLQRFEGPHPPQISRLMDDVARGVVPMAMRPMDDVEWLLQSPRYAAGRRLLQLAEPLDRHGRRWRRSGGSAARRVVRAARGGAQAS